MEKSKAILLACCCTLSLSSYAQLVTNGQNITIQTDGLLYVDAEVKNVQGTILNNGKLEVTGNIVNSDLNSTLFDVQSVGEVELAGDMQMIDGSRIVFPSLTLSGTNDKVLNTDIDLNATGVLSLADKRLYAETFSLHVTNPSVDAITRTTGFISTEGGSLVRNTNTDFIYSFPLGSTSLNANLPGVTTLYRPMTFKPENSFENTFSASLVNHDPTNDNYDKTKKRYDVKNVSDKYYYLLGQKAGTSKFDITFYQNSTVEDHTQLVYWGNYLQWEKAAPSTVFADANIDDLNGGTLNTRIHFSSIESFANRPFTFSSELGGVNPFTFFNAFSPDGDNRNDTWAISNIELYPENKLTIYNRWGDEVYSAVGYTNEKAWDGGNMQSGTYYYVLTATIQNQARVFKGFITMIKKN